MTDDWTDAQRYVVVRSGAYAQESLDLTLHDPDLTDEEMLPPVLAAVDGSGLDATVTRWHPHLERAVVGINVGFADYEGDDEAAALEWDELARKLSAIVEAVQPSIALLGINVGGGDLPEDSWDATCMAWHTGFVRRNSLDARRTAAFEQLVTRGHAFALGHGIAWGPRGLLDPEGRNKGSEGDVAGLAYAAWTGRPVPKPPPPVEPIDLMDVNLPTLWFYDPRVDPLDLLTGVEATLLEDFSVWIDDYDPEWTKVVARPPEELTDQDVLLDHLRSVARAVHPAWAALMPIRGFFIPGVDLDVPESGNLDHVWVHDDWIGSRRDDLRAALVPVEGERVGAGELFVTATDPRAPGGATSPYPEGERFGRLREASRVLGEVARAYLGEPA